MLAALWRAGVYVVLVALVGVLAVAVVVPRIAGATPYTVLTGSMRPHLPPGTLVVVRPIDAKDIRAGDVVTYQLESGKPQVVTHRVVSVANRLDGSRAFTTQGDANSAPDPKQVRPEQVRGKLWYVVPKLGHVQALLTGRQRELVSYLAGVALAAYALVLFAGAMLDRLKDRKERTTL